MAWNLVAYMYFFIPATLGVIEYLYIPPNQKTPLWQGDNIGNHDIVMFFVIEKIFAP